MTMINGSQVSLPKYVTKANKILEVICTEPNQTWTKTQRELGQIVELSLPELSNLVKTLEDAGRIRKGEPLEGRRGRTFSLVVINSTPITSAIRRDINRNEEVLAPDEIVDGPIELSTLTMEQIGYAVMRMAKKNWETEERLSATHSDLVARLRDLREELAEEKRIKQHLNDINETYERKIAAQTAEMIDMRTEINTLLMRVNGERRSSPGSFKISEMLEDDEVEKLAKLLHAER